MKKLSYFLMVGLAFTALQVATVEALDDPNMPPAGMSGGQCDSNPACDPSDPAANCCAGMCDPNPACVMDDPNAIPCCSSEGNDMSSGTPPQRGSAPPGHDEMSHDRVPQHKMGGKLREKLEECHNKLEMQTQPQPTLAQSNPAPNCTGSVQQATSANQALDEICISLNDVINSLQVRIAALPPAPTQTGRNLQQAGNITQNYAIRSFQEQVFDQHCPNPGEQ